jgi:hypothetical protein
MPATITTELVRARGTSVLASDIPVQLTVAEYRQRSRRERRTSLWKHPVARFRSDR